MEKRIYDFETFVESVAAQVGELIDAGGVVVMVDNEFGEEEEIVAAPAPEDRNAQPDPKPHGIIPEGGDPIEEEPKIEEEEQDLSGRDELGNLKSKPGIMPVAHNETRYIKTFISFTAMKSI